MGEVSLFIPCTVDLLLAPIGQATAQLLERLGAKPYFRPQQTCCGHPAITAGADELALTLARRFIEIFEEDPAIVSPSGSCVYTVKHLYPKLLASDPLWHRKALNLRDKVYELSQYLIDELGVTDLNAEFSGKVAYHHSCSLLHHLGVEEQPLRLLGMIKGLELVPLNEADVCCGFGGEFSYRYHELSQAILEDKVKNFINSEADVLVVSDTGCFLNIKGYLLRHHPEKKVFHLAHFLAIACGLMQDEVQDEKVGVRA